jgi:hypothetical protein
MIDATYEQAVDLARLANSLSPAEQHRLISRLVAWYPEAVATALHDLHLPAGLRVIDTSGQLVNPC